MSTTSDNTTSTMEGAFELIATGALFADRYAVEERIGVGALSIVYSALDMIASRSRRVALKVARNMPVAKTSLAHEAIVLAKIHNLGTIQNVVQLVEQAVQQHNGLSYLVLEHIEGQTLRRAGLSLSEVCRVGQTLAHTLATLHAAGIVVADIKPDNIMLRPGNTPVFIDFGAARLGRESSEPALLTPAYAAPEQLAGHAPTFAGDVFALAKTLEESAGKRLPKKFVALVNRWQAQNPDERPTALELAHALGDIDVSQSRSRWVWFVAGSSLLTVLLAGMLTRQTITAKAPETALSTRSPPLTYSNLSAPERALFLAADEKFVYWSRVNDGTVQRVPLEGGPTEVVTRIDGRAYQLAISGQTLFIRDGSDIWSFAQNELRRFADAAGDGDIVADSRDVVWTNAYTGEVFIKAVHGDRPARVLASGLAKPYDVTMDATHAYWANLDGRIMRVARQGGDVDVLARGQSWPVGTLVDETHVYWLERHSGGLFRVPKQGGEPVRIANTAIDCPATAFDGTHIYWTSPADRRLMRVLASGGDPETLVAGPPGFHDIIAHRKTIYYTNYLGTEGVMRLSLPSP